MSRNGRWWHRAACQGEDPDLFFPTRGEAEKIAAAKQVCSGCPVKHDCLSDALLRRELYGIHGGAGEAVRRGLVRLLADSPHPEAGWRPRCRCPFCAEMGSHFKLLAAEVAGVRAGARSPVFGPGASHGKSSTYSRGCRCRPCRVAAVDRSRAG